MRELRITARVIPHDEQRYPTVGDWTYDEVGDENPKTILHVRQQAVDEFDMNFEANRKDGDISEPGDDPKAPYYRQHQIASTIERLLALELGVNWEEYAKELEEMP